MPEEPQRKSRSGLPAKAVAISALSVVIGFGLCSAGGGFMNATRPGLVETGMFVFWGGVLSLIVSLVWLFISGVVLSRNE